MADTRKYFLCDDYQIPFAMELLQAEQSLLDTLETQSKCNDKTVQNWCAANDVPYIGTGQRKQYMLYPEHEEGFKNREKPGRRWPVKKIKKKK